MQKIKVDLKHCYGIKDLKHTFDFSDRSAYAVYAPNGAMKSSFAQIFKDIAEGNESRDRIFTTRVSTRAVTDEMGQSLPRDAVMVIRPYAEEFGHSEKTSTLLVNATLRTEYEQLHVDTDKVKDRLLKALKKQSGSKADIEREISLAFTANEDQFYRALIRIKDELRSQADAPLAAVKYDVILDDKVQAFLDTSDAKDALESYILKYNELLAASTYFRRGTFNYYNASSVAKSLAEDGFFNAKHTVSLNADTSLRITSERELADLIAKEKETVSEDPALRERFAAIETLITKNVNLRQFEEYIATHEELLPKLANRAQLKEELWKSYLKANYAVYEELLECYAATAKRKKEIEDEAARQRTQWEQVIDIFNSRFFVPFKLTAKNRVSVILGDEPMLTLSFSFTDGGEEVSVEKAALMPWHDLPRRYPPYQTCHRRFQLWVRSGRLDKLLQCLAEDLRDRGKLDLSEAFVDATFVSAKKGGPPLALFAAVRGARSWRSATAMVFLSPSTWPVLHRMSRTSSPRPSRRASFEDLPSRLIGDRGYDSDALDVRLMSEYGIEMIAANRRGRTPTQDGRPLRRARRRWKIERLFAWLHNCRRVVTRWERHVENYLGMVQLACARILLRAFMR